MLRAVQLVRKEHHREVELYSEFPADAVDPVESFRVLTDEMHRDDPSARICTHPDEGFVPFRVLDDAVIFPGTLPGRKNQNVTVGCEHLAHLGRKIPGLAPDLVDRNAHRGKSLQIHQEIIDHEFDIPAQFI